MSMRYKPRTIQCRCSVCKEAVADFIVPYLWDKVYCWDCFKKEMESQSDLKLSIISTKLILKKIKKNKNTKSKLAEQQFEEALESIKKWIEETRS